MKKKISAAIDEELIVLLDRVKGPKRSRSSVIEFAIRAYLKAILHEEAGV